MTIRQVGTVLRPLVMLVLSLSFGCAQQMKSVQAEPVAGLTATAQIQRVTVADDASTVEIVSDKPIVYTYYMLENPPRVIVDIAQTEPGKQPFPMIVNKAGVKQIDITRHEFGSGVLSRIDISLNSMAEISGSLDQLDKKKLILSIPVPPAEKQELLKTEATVPVVTSGATPLSDESKPVVPENIEASKVTDTQVVPGMQLIAEPVIEVPVKGALDRIDSPEPALQSVKSATEFRPGERALTAIKTNSDGVMLEISTEPDSFKAFKLTQPDRLVIDIPKTRNGISSKLVEVNAFSLGRARIGAAPDKLRIVFDAIGIIPPYIVTKNSTGVLIAFGDRARIQESGVSSQNPVQVDVAPVNPPIPVIVERPAVTKMDQLEPVIKESAKAENSILPVPVPVSAPVAAKQVSLPVVSSGSVPVKSAAHKYGPGVVEAVEFRQIDGISSIIIRTSGNCTAGDPVKNSKGYSLAIKGCRLPTNLQRQLDTSGFDSAIASISPYSVKGRTAPETRLAVTLRTPLPYTIHKDVDLVQWDFKETVKVVKAAKTAKTSAANLKFTPQAPLENDIADSRQDQPKSKADKTMDDAFSLEKASQPVTGRGKTYTGRKVTLEFSDADVKKIFQLLAEVSNQNILVSDDVTGTISLKLINVPWDQALDVILENKGLGMQKDGNIVQIRPKSKMKSLDDEAVEMRFSEEKKMPLSTVIFDINFATLGDIEKQFMQLKSKRTDSSISIDTRTNKIIVVDIDPNINKMRKLLEQLDIPEKQVMIEARIVEASSNFARDIGVKWNFGYQDGSASIANINNATGSMGGVVSSILPTATTGGVAAGMSFGKLLSNIQLDMRLSAAATVGQVKIISSPKVLTVNNKPAKISQGQMIPYQNTSSTDGAKTEFIEAALSLEVTPHITSDGSVNMKIKASNNTAGVGTPPPINKKEATTELTVKNGETTVIGGIYVDSETEGETGVPYLSDIPLLGWLFKSNSKSKTKNEMLIFITPKIMN